MPFGIGGGLGLQQMMTAQAALEPAKAVRGGWEDWSRWSHGHPAGQDTAWNTQEHCGGDSGGGQCGDG